MKLCFISDTHNDLDKITDRFIEPCDYLFHTGDLTNFGTIPELEKAYRDLKNLKNLGLVKENIILIGGNHDMLLDKNMYLGKSIFKDLVYLHDNIYTLNNGFIVYGTPYVKKFYNWAFMKSEEELEIIYEKIPDVTNILLTHAPKYGVLDKNHINERCGSISLLNKVSKLENLKIHASGHIHDSHSIIQKNGIYHINSAIMGKDYIEYNDPIYLEI